MSLVEAHRSRRTTRHNRWLMGYLGLAVAIHAAAAMGIARWNFPLLTQSQPPTQTAIPLDFVTLEDPSPADSPPVQATRQAQTNSTAGKTAQPNQPVQPGGITRLRTAAVPPSPAPRPALRPQPPAPNRPLQPPARATARSAQPALPLPTQSSPVAESNPAADLPLASSNPSSRPPSPAPLLSPAPASESAAALGAPQTLSLEGIGLGNQLNANRLGSGTGVDASEEATWGTYLSGLNRLIDQHWQRVAVSATRRTRIQFRVNRQGRLTEWNLLESSGDAAADQAAIQAIRAAAPFAPLPQNASEEVLIVNFTFTQWLSPGPSP